MLPEPEHRIYCIVIDCSALNYIDTVGVKTLDRVRKFRKTSFNSFVSFISFKKMIIDFHENDVMIYLAECNGKLKL